MGRMKTSADTMSVAAGRIDGLTQEIAGIVGRLRADVAAAGAGWEGTASGAFTDVMGRWDSSATRLNAALTSIGESIKSSGVHYESTDTDNTRAISGAAGSLNL